MNNHVDVRVRISRELNDAIIRYCSKHGEKKSALVRRALEEAIKRAPPTTSELPDPDRPL